MWRCLPHKQATTLIVYPLFRVQTGSKHAGKDTSPLARCFIVVGCSKVWVFACHSHHLIFTSILIFFSLILSFMQTHSSFPHSSPHISLIPHLISLILHLIFPHSPLPYLPLIPHLIFLSFLPSLHPLLFHFHSFFSIFSHLFLLFPVSFLCPFLRPSSSKPSLLAPYLILYQILFYLLPLNLFTPAWY